MSALLGLVTHVTMYHCIALMPVQYLKQSNFITGLITHTLFSVNLNYIFQYKFELNRNKDIARVCWQIIFKFKKILLNKYICLTWNTVFEFILFKNIITVNIMIIFIEYTIIKIFIKYIVNSWYLDELIKETILIHIMFERR